MNFLVSTSSYSYHVLFGPCLSLSGLLRSVLADAWRPGQRVFTLLGSIWCQVLCLLSLSRSVLVVWVHRLLSAFSLLFLYWPSLLCLLSALVWMGASITVVDVGSHLPLLNAFSTA